MRKAIIAGVVAFMAMPFAAWAESYYVYCASDRIEVDSRDPEQMKIARGSGVCQLSSFSSRSDAESFAKKNFGGVGGKCSCR